MKTDSLRESIQQYKDFRPTSFDPRGLACDDRQDWYVVPFGRNRDSETPGGYYDSNFHVCLKRLGGESDTVEIHRFGHWARGWFEIILVHPSRFEDVFELASQAEDYPLLDDEDYSAREWEYALNWWNQGGTSQRLDLIHGYNERRASWEPKVSIFAARREELPRDDSGGFFEYLTRE